MLRAVLLVALLSMLAACSTNNVTEDESLKKYFDSAGVTGSFGLFNNGQGSFSIYNLSRFKDSAYLPASTFKIVNGLIGIETGRITDSSTLIKWDGIVRTFSNGDTLHAWNKDLRFDEAFKVSAVPYFQELARRIGKDTMQSWLDTLGYGAKFKKPVITNNLDTFWLDNTVKVTADEQLGLVKKLYFDQLPFQKRSQKMIRTVMLQKENANYALSYKTGWATKEDGKDIGWIVGWIEENKHPYFFVLQIENSNPAFDMKTGRLAILNNILKQYGFFEGKK
ncbi:MAG: hypothetical protein RLZZ316_648 [Bacteroidota bacterium]